MSLYKEPIAEIIEAIGQVNNVFLVEDQYVWGPPELAAVGVGGDNTSTLITSKGEASAYDGEVSVRYHRRDLTELEALIPLEVTAFNIQTHMDLARRLNDVFGLNFTADDIVDGPAGLVDGVGEVTLVAKPLSRGWTGQVTFSVLFGERPLEQFLTVTRLPGLSYPSASTEKPYAAVYAYWRNFSDWVNELEEVAVGTGQLSTLLDVLRAATGDDWKLDTVSRYSLKGAKVTFVGTTADEPLSNPDYDKVIIVELDEVSSTILSGSLIMHYYLS